MKDTENDKTLIKIKDDLNKWCSIIMDWKTQYC